MKLLLPFLCVAAAAAQQVLFQPHGDMWLSQGTLDARFQLNLTALRDRCDGIKWWIAEIDKVAVPERMNAQWSEHWHSTKASIEATVMTACGGLASWPDMFGRPAEEDERPKRQIGIIAASVFATFGLNGIIDSFTHGGLQGQVDRLADDLTRVHDGMEILVREFLAEKGWRDLQWHLNSIHTGAVELATVLQTTSNGFMTLVSQRRITADLLPLPMARKFWVDAQRFARDQGVSIPPVPESVFELPASYRLFADRLEVVLHIPILHEKLRLYSLLPFPVEGPDGKAFMLSSEEHFLGIADSNAQFTTLRAADLTACDKVDSVPICLLTGLRRDVDGSCLASLFVGHWSAAASNCQFDANPPAWALARGGDGGLHLFSRDDMALTWHCGEDSRTETSPAGFSSLSVSEECQVSSLFFHVPRRVHLDFASSVAVDVTWTPIMMEAASNASNLQDLQKRLQERDSSKVEVSLSLVVALALTLTVTAVVLCAVLFGVWRSARKEAKRKQPEPPQADQ